jgi:hypothetical protein
MNPRSLRFCGFVSSYSRLQSSNTPTFGILEGTCHVQDAGSTACRCFIDHVFQPDIQVTKLGPGGPLSTVVIYWETRSNNRELSYKKRNDKPQEIERQMEWHTTKWNGRRDRCSVHSTSISNKRYSFSPLVPPLPFLKCDLVSLLSFSRRTHEVPKAFYKIESHPSTSTAHISSHDHPRLGRSPNHPLPSPFPSTLLSATHRASAARDISKLDAEVRRVGSSWCA